MMMIVALILFLIPFAIVGLWKKRPIIALICAAILSFLLMVLPGLIQTFQAMMIYGTGDPQLMAGGISRALASAMVGLIFTLPLLIGFQLIARYIWKRKAGAKAINDFD